MADNYIEGSTGINLLVGSLAAAGLEHRDRSRLPDFFGPPRTL
jgi:hypothetical protein